MRLRLIVFSGVMLAGCGPADDERCIPSDEVAQHALETALNAWRKGKLPPTQAQERSPAIQLVDTQYQPARKLAGFRVLGPTTGDARRCYAVRLMLEDPIQEVRARFVVWGIDPLWVMRYEDYEMVMHWEMPHHEAAPAKKP